MPYFFKISFNIILSFTVLPIFPKCFNVACTVDLPSGFSIRVSIGTPIKNSDIGDNLTCSRRQKPAKWRSAYVGAKFVYFWFIKDAGSNSEYTNIYNNGVTSKQ